MVSSWKVKTNELSHQYWRINTWIVAAPVLKEDILFALVIKAVNRGELLFCHMRQNQIQDIHYCSFVNLLRGGNVSECRGRTCEWASWCFFICLILFAFEWRGHVVLACIQLSLKVYSIWTDYISMTAISQFLIRTQTFFLQMSSHQILIYT